MSDDIKTLKGVSVEWVVIIIINRLLFFRLKIKSVKLTDSGEFSCRSNGNSESLILEVKTNDDKMMIPEPLKIKTKAAAETETGGVTSPGKKMKNLLLQRDVPSSSSSDEGIQEDSGFVNDDDVLSVSGTEIHAKLYDAEKNGDKAKGLGRKKEKIFFPPFFRKKKKKNV